jgi:hypothetical protein
MPHEKSRTVEDDLGRWWNVYGPGATGGLEGSLLPEVPYAPGSVGPFETAPEGSKAAKERSDRYRHPEEKERLRTPQTLQEAAAHNLPAVQQAFGGLPIQTAEDPRAPFTWPASIQSGFWATQRPPAEPPANPEPTEGLLEWFFQRVLAGFRR